MRRYIALTITAVLALALAPSGVAEASHEPGHSQLVVDITKPARGSVSGTVDVAVTITEDYTLRRIRSYEVSLLNPNGTVASVFCSETYGEEPPDGSLTLAFKWDTNRFQTKGAVQNCDGGNPTLPASGNSEGLPNNNYTIHAEATLTDVQEGDGPTVPDSVDVGVSNAPATPTGVKLTYRESTGKITVSWSANPEDYDAIDYRVQECKVDRSSKPCGSWKTLDDVSATSLTVTRTKPGIYRYRVVALRPAPDGSTLTSAGAGTPQSEPTEIHVEDDDDPTTSSTEPEGETAGDEQAPPEPEIRTVERPTRRVQRAAPQVLQRIVEEDPGFSDELPYENDDSEKAIGGLPGSSDDDDGGGQRAVLIPLAGGTLLLVFALQVHYLNRRASRNLEPVPAEAFDGDWAE